MRFELDLARWSKTIAKCLKSGERLSWAVSFARNITDRQDFRRLDQDDHLVRFVKCVATGNVTASGRAKCLLHYMNAG